MSARPPRLTRWMLVVLTGAAISDDLLQDLDERFRRLHEGPGRRTARRWYRRQLWRYARETIIRRGIPLTRHPSSLRSPTRRSPLSGLRQDIRFAFRSLRKSPGFTASTMFILILGIGGTTAVFSVLNGVLLRPLPYFEPDRLVSAWTINQGQNLPDGSSQWNVRDWLERSQTVEDLAMYFRPEFTTTTITDFGEPERVHVGGVTGNFFRLLGVEAVLGRTFGPDDVAGGERLAVLNESYWRQHFAGSPDVLGSRVTALGNSYQVVGVVPSSLRIPRPTTMIWVLHDPYRSEPGPTSRRNDAYVVLGRLNAGVPVHQAQSELSSIAAQLAEEYPETNRELGIRVRPLLYEITGERLPFVLWTLFGAVTLVLLITATNVAHLVLARGVRRNRELAIRAALGASRGRIIRQLVVELGVLGGLATLGGVALGAVVLDGFVRMLPADMPRLDEIGLNIKVVAVAIASTVLVAPMFGLMPALWVSRQDPTESLREGGRGASGRHGLLRKVLVTGQVAVAVILIAEAGLLLRSARAVIAADPGYDAQAVLLAEVDLDPSLYQTNDQRNDFVRTVLARLQALPDVEGAGVISDFFIRRFPDMRIRVEGQPVVDTETLPRLTGDAVYPGFFEAAGLPVLAGREFVGADLLMEGPPRMVVVNRSAAAEFWPNKSPVGERFRWSDQHDSVPGIEVIGVVPDMRRGPLEEEAYPNLFFPGLPASMDLVVRTRGNPLEIADDVRRVVHEADETVPVSQVATAWDRFGESVAERRVQSWLMGAFSGLALLLAVIGLYGLLYDAVNVRRREIGIRIALGATPGTVRRLVLSEGLILSSIGLLVGLLSAGVVSGLTRSLLYGIEPWDPVTLLSVSISLMGAAVLASWLPARRATTVEPTETLNT